VLSRPITRCLTSTRLMSSSGSADAKITVTNDGQTVVCWHPTEHFPYEHSRPIPESHEELKEDESILKIQHRIDGQNIFRGSGPDLEEVQMLTYTPSYVWTKRARKRSIPKPPHPREGI